MAGYLTSTELAKLLSVSPATIRRWANSGLLPAERTAGGHRRFSRAVAERLARQTVRHQLGTDDWIRALLAPESPLEVDSMLLASRSQERGWFEVAETLGRVLIELGVRWQVGQVSVVDEHIASARLARALARAADSLPVRAGAPQALLATAENEDHTLGLSLVDLVMREWGWSVVWVGRDLSTEQLLGRVVANGVDVLAMSATTCAAQSDLSTIAARVSDACQRAGVELVLGGRGAWPKKLPHGSTVRTFDGLRTWMAGVDARRVDRSRGSP